jgi:hypothetical protein
MRKILSLGARTSSAAGDGVDALGSIPRIFHRIWLGGTAMPDEYKRFGDTWRRHNPYRFSQVVMNLPGT